MADNNIGKNNNPLRTAKFFHFAVSCLLFFVTWYLNIRIYGIAFDPRYNYFVAALYIFLMYFFSRTYNSYLVGFSSPHDIAFSQDISSTLSTAALYFSTMIVWNKWRNPLPFIVSLPVHYVFNTVWSRFADKLFFRYSYTRKTVLICGESDKSRIISDITEFVRGFDFRETAVISENDPLPVDLICRYSSCFAGGLSADQRRQLAMLCSEKGIACYFIPDAGDVIMEGAYHIQSFYVPVFGIRSDGVQGEYLALKRLIDILVSSVALIVLSPVFLLTALAIKLDDKGPVFYKQVRLTKDSEKFEIIKFRSMRTDAEKDGVARLSSEHDDRITKVGKIIRSCRIDELPQLVNVLKGDMSLVGPRPERPEIAEQYEKTLPEFRLRLKVKAGITGYAQVYGRYDSTPQDKLLLDLIYINRMNMRIDLKLLFATVKILFVRESTHGIEDGKTTAGE